MTGRCLCLLVLIVGTQAFVCEWHVDPITVKIPHNRRAPYGSSRNEIDVVRSFYLSSPILSYSPYSRCSALLQFAY